MRHYKARWSHCPTNNDQEGNRDGRLEVLIIATNILTFVTHKHLSTRHEDTLR